MIGNSFLHFAKIKAGLEQPRTQTTPEERNTLSRFLPGMKTIVEIGVFEGFTTRVLADRADSDAIIYGIDPFPKGRLGVCWGEMITRAHNRDHLKGGRVKLIAKLSTDVDEDVPSLVDFVFIDGDHSLAGITSDWAYWSTKVRPGGYIGLHDSFLTPEKPKGYTLGSIDYFGNHIRHDPGFAIVAQQDSLAVLQKNSG